MEIINYTNKYISEFSDLGQKAKFYVDNSKSQRTRTIYKNGWECFMGWCIERGLSYLPAQIETVIAYLIEKAQIFKVSTIDLRLLCIRDAHRSIGQPLEDRTSLLSQTLKGIRNIHGAPQTRKQPILLQDLKEMVSSLGDSLIGIRDKAILLTGFAGAFRSAEIVAICIEHLKFTRDGIEIMLPRSKTDQEGRGEIVPIPYGSNPITCPVRAVQDWLNASKLTEGYLFRGIKKGGRINPTGMISTSICQIVKKNPYMSMMNGDFSSHSLRAGFCTQAAMKGVQEYSIMRQSRISRSDTVKKYIRYGTMWQDCAAMKVGL